MASSSLFETARELVFTGTSILLDAGFWIVVSLVAAGIVYEYLGTSRLSRFMRHQGAGSIAGALGAGALLPMCSCGVVPLAVSLRLTGVRLASVMTFTAATPVINPAAVLLSYALLGPHITLAYVLFGLTVPVLVGLVVERFGTQGETDEAVRLKQCCCGGNETQNAGTEVAGRARFTRAMRWGFTELGPTLGLYLAVGIALASIIMTLSPTHWIPQHLGGAAPFSSLLIVALLGMVIYVCAVAHIPLVAALLAAGASPGIAVVFLVTGAVTNLPELIALQRILGRRTIAVYVISLVVASIGAGWLLNLWLLPAFSPQLAPVDSMRWGDLADRVSFVIPETLAIASAVVVAGLCVWGVGRWLRARIPARWTGRTAAPQE
ncbi:permease [Thiohalophilus sp.]|uniref:permease n=1 Tax=Thiohalophilus sp. TaxID=3028392 RepID=UPI002ACEEBE6|nr:permease [Thiohalophilus sp.]MDZ7663683.1 permease [Thiohalophilus sp.]